MAEFNWKGWGLIPLFCSKKEFETIVSGDLWQHWAHDLKDEEIKEIKDGEGREEEGRNFCDNEMIMKCHF